MKSFNFWANKCHPTTSPKSEDVSKYYLFIYHVFRSKTIVTLYICHGINILHKSQYVPAIYWNHLNITLWDENFTWRFWACCQHAQQGSCGRHLAAWNSMGWNDKPMALLQASAGSDTSLAKTSYDKESSFDPNNWILQLWQPQELPHRRRFRSRTSDLRTDAATMVRAVREEKESQKEDQEKQDQGARKGRKLAKHCVFPIFCGPRGSTSRLAQAAGAEPSGRMRNQKLHAAVARSTFRSAKVCRRFAELVAQAEEHFWKLGCPKSAGNCGAKDVSKPRY